MSISQLNAQERLRATMAAAALRSQAAARTPAPSTTVRQPDGVSISAEARSMAAARNATVGAGEVREDRIAALKAAIANGTYSVSARDLAHSLLKASDVVGR
jgi:negative regulator of flagellin synthesis FlgM